tara:strand:- start:122 stop:292 length:171 start_codon:yes stop_codon:yes gene_type:complete
MEEATEEAVSILRLHIFTKADIRLNNSIAETDPPEFTVSASSPLRSRSDINDFAKW